jgi:hypothetical protein
LISALAQFRPKAPGLTRSGPPWESRIDFAYNSNGGASVIKMSFDLNFCRQNRSAPATSELKEYFSAQPCFEVSDVAEGGVEFVYQNEETGVYCIFSYSPLDAAESQGCGASGLAFNLNYGRPTFFALETMPLVERFCKHFDLLVEDPQDETMQAAEASRLISSWQSHNTSAMGTMKKVAEEENMELHYFPEAKATEWWRYTSIRKGIEDSMVQDIFVPSLLIVVNPARTLLRLMVWPKGIPQFFPTADYVYVEREKKRLFGKKEEAGLVPYESVISACSALLEEFDFGEYRLKYLTPEKTASAEKVVESLELEPVDLSKYTRIASDDFHDVL